MMRSASNCQQLVCRSLALCERWVSCCFLVSAADLHFSLSSRARRHSQPEHPLLPAPLLLPAQQPLLHAEPREAIQCFCCGMLPLPSHRYNALCIFKALILCALLFVLQAGQDIGRQLCAHFAFRFMVAEPLYPSCSRMCDSIRQR
mmetsp:Transcript_56265/g.134089  ORF Transcript_56265/g.134089 Transcript_56265/m.134089 type:complete len:146 (+) Transcript_56265:875-1312(+)